MKKMKLLSLILSVLMCCVSASYAQVRPITLAERVNNNCATIVIGQLKEQHGFWDAAHQRLNTLNVFDVKATLKGDKSFSTVSMITEGGIVDLQATHACPSDEIDAGQDYMIFLKNEEQRWFDPAYKAQHPDVVQAVSHYVLAVLPYQNGKYIDLFGKFAYSEADLLTEMNKSFGLTAKTPSGETYRPREFRAPAIAQLRTVTTVTDGTGSTPASGFIAGTIVMNNEIIINGSGFGATAGTLVFHNADTPPPPAMNAATVGLTNVSDLISWSDVQIRAKIPRRAGTGILTVKNTGGTDVGSTTITVAWAEICLDDPSRTLPLCETTGSNIRHRLELTNVNTGGYNFLFNDGTGASASFAANANAKAAFTRAVATWRCATLVDFSVNTASTTTGFVSGDGNSVVLYADPSVPAIALPANALGVCTTAYSGSCSGACTNNVRWFHRDMDIRVLTIPYTDNAVMPAQVYTWNYTTANPTGLEYDFESVMLHEVGHGHGLGHVNDAAKTMHYAISNGSNKRTLSTAEVTAGTFKMAHSTPAQCTGSPITPISASSCSAALPIELTAFAAINKGDKNILNWETASERNSSHFVVQKSKDGVNFVDIATVKAHGSTGTPQYYDLIDAAPYRGINYYRLQQVDVDGSSEASKIVSVKWLKDGKQSVSMYPNPTDKLLTVEHTNAVKTIEVVNALGQILTMIQVPEASVQTNITTADLSKGIYFLRINQTDMVRFVKF
jgi:hypothetical protein